MSVKLKDFKFRTKVHSMNTETRKRIFIKINHDLEKDVDKEFRQGEYLQVHVYKELEPLMFFHARIQRTNKGKKLNRFYNIEVPTSHLSYIRDWMYEDNSIIVNLQHLIPIE